MNQASRNECNTIQLCPENFHTFSLKPLNQRAAIRENLCVSFKPVELFDQQPKGSVDCPVQKDASSKPTLLFATLPKFNFDKDSSTQAFISEAQSYASSGWSQHGCNLGLYAVNRAFQQSKNLQSLFLKNEASEQIIFQPKPANNYCSICLETFADYLKHIQHKVHKKKLKESPFNEQIDNLIAIFHSSESKAKKLKGDKEKDSNAKSVFQWPVLRKKHRQAVKKQKEQSQVSDLLTLQLPSVSLSQNSQEGKKRRHDETLGDTAESEFSFGQRNEPCKKRIVQNTQFLPQSTKITIKHCSRIKNEKAFKNDDSIHSQLIE